MDQSILTSTKKILGFDPTYTAFDQDVITHINSVFATLNQMGVGPDAGFSIEDDSAQWSDFLPDSPILSLCKTYIFMKVRYIFDTPEGRYAIAAIQEQIKEQEWRISSMREAVSWVPGTPPADQEVPIQWYYWWDS